MPSSSGRSAPVIGSDAVVVVACVVLVCTGDVAVGVVGAEDVVVTAGFGLGLGLGFVSPAGGPLSWPGGELDSVGIDAAASPAPKPATTRASSSAADRWQTIRAEL